MKVYYNSNNETGKGDIRIITMSHINEQDNEIDKNYTKTTYKPMHIIRICLVLLGAGLIVMGINNGDYADIMNKAVRICYECIGIG